MKQQQLTCREKIVLGAMIREKIEQALKIEGYGIVPAAKSEELKAIYKKVTGIEWRQ